MRYRAIIISILVVIGLGIVLFLPATREALFAIARWAESNPALAWPVYLVTLVLAVICLLPAWMFMMAGGYLFGAVPGTVLSIAGYVIGATIVFILARTIGRNWAQERIAHSARFIALDRAVEKNGFMAILLSRLALVFPYNLLNFALGLTGVRLRDFVLGTALGTLPVLIANVLIGAATTDLLTAIEQGTLQAGSAIWMVPVALGALIAVFVLLRYIRARASRSALGDMRNEE